MASALILYVAANTITTLWFSNDTDIRTCADMFMSVACCLLPIIPIGYAYRWCNKFVRGEI